MNKFVEWVTANTKTAAILIVVLAVGWAAAGLSFFICIR